MKNGDMPAMPMITLTEESQYNGMKYVEAKNTYSGLTKREHFAASAPEAPSWFKNYLYEKDPNYRQIEHHKGAADIGSYLFFAWRTYYADALLAELERTK